QVADGPIALRIVNRADLRAQYWSLIGIAVVLEVFEPFEDVERAHIGEATGLLDVDHVRDRQEVAADVTEDLAASVSLDVPGEPESRRDHVVNLDVAVTVRVLVVEGIGAHPEIEHEGVGNLPAVFEIERSGG